MTNPNKPTLLEISPMPTTLEIPADLTLLLSRQVLSEYSLACDAAQSAAEQCAIPDHPSEHARSQLRECRARVNAAEHVLNLVSSVAPAQPWKVCFQSPDRHVIATLLGTELKRQSADLGLTEDEILATAGRIPRLRTLLDSCTAVSSS
jgi:hypothetical protein